jgi:methyl-accepting chemotaxis protein
VPVQALLSCFDASGWRFADLAFHSRSRRKIYVRPGKWITERTGGTQPRLEGDLARATARATDDIAKMIATIQSDAEEAVAMIRDIGLVVSRINDFQSTIAGAVEEQTASSNEMTRSIADAASASGDIAWTIVSVAAAALATASGVDETMEASVDVHRTAGELADVVGRFRY